MPVVEEGQNWWQPEAALQSKQGGLYCVDVQTGLGDTLLNYSTR